MKELHPKIYRLSLTLADNPLKKIHTYIIKGDQFSLLIDTGFNDTKTKNQILKSLSTLNISLNDLKVFISHLHADHAGLADFFYHKGCEIFASQEDAGLINQMIDGSFELPLKQRITLLDLDQYQITKNNLPKFESENKSPINFTILAEEDSICVGNYQFKVINVAGHTPGMLALYESEHQLFFGADHILDQISPNIAYWDEQFPSLDIFLKNLQKMIPYKIKTIYPSHRNEMFDHPRRAMELIDHHYERLEEVLNILTQERKSLSASQVAMRMQWNFRAPSWEEFPKPQKFFATHEAMAHLEYLHQKNKITKIIKHNIAYFRCL